MTSKPAKQKGFTLYELVYILGFLAVSTLVIVVIAHFIIKYW